MNSPDSMNPTRPLGSKRPSEQFFLPGSRGNCFFLPLGIRHPHRSLSKALRQTGKVRSTPAAITTGWVASRCSSARTSGSSARPKHNIFFAIREAAGGRGALGHTALHGRFKSLDIAPKAGRKMADFSCILLNYIERLCVRLAA